MIYIKKFEDLNKDNYFKYNDILLIDCSASFMPDIKIVLKNNLYLSYNFVLILTDYNNTKIFKNIKQQDIPELFKYFGHFDGLQNGFDIISKEKLSGNLLVLSDGYNDIRMSKLGGIIHNLTWLSTYVEPTLINLPDSINYYLFEGVYDLENTNIIYPPRYNNNEEFKIAKSAKQYNL